MLKSSQVESCITSGHPCVGTPSTFVRGSSTTSAEPLQYRRRHTTGKKPSGMKQPPSTTTLAGESAQSNKLALNSGILHRQQQEDLKVSMQCETWRLPSPAGKQNRPVYVSKILNYIHGSTRQLASSTSSYMKRPNMAVYQEPSDLSKFHTVLIMLVLFKKGPKRNGEWGFGTHIRWWWWW